MKRDPLPGTLRSVTGQAWYLNRTYIGIMVDVMYSPSTNRVCTPYAPGMQATLQLNDEFEADPNPIHAAPIGVKPLSESFSNENITDWKQRQIERWTDLKTD